MERRNVLVIGLEAEHYLERARVLRRVELEVDRFPRAANALALLGRVPFKVLLLRYPLPGMELEPFLAAVRDPASPCRRAAVVLLPDRSWRDEAESWIGRGVNRVVTLDEPGVKLHDVVAELLEVAPRLHRRLFVRVQVQTLTGTERIVCQSINVSRTGMLLETDRRYSPATRVQIAFQLPDESEPCTGAAEVVRHTTGGRERGRGIAVRFDRFDAGAGERLERYLSRVAPGEAEPS